MKNMVLGSAFTINTAISQNHKLIWRMGQVQCHQEFQCISKPP